MSRTVLIRSILEFKFIRKDKTLFLSGYGYGIKSTIKDFNT